MIYIVYCSKSVHKHGFNKEPIDAVDTQRGLCYYKGEIDG